MAGVDRSRRSVSRSRFVRFLLALCLLTGSSAGRASVEEPLIFGVFPYVAAKKVVETYRPLAASLEKQLGRRVLLYTAPDFKTFVERTRHGEYDVLLTAPHLAWIASEDAHYLPLLEHARPIHGLVVVRHDAAFDSLNSLRGQTIATPTPIALVVLATQAELKTRGLKPGDYTTIDAITHVNAAMQVIQSRAAAAMLAQQPYSTMHADDRARLRVVHRTRALPGLVYLTHPRLGVHESDAIRAALYQFGQSVEGRAFLRRGQFGSLRPISLDRLGTMQPYAQQARAQIGAAQ